MAVKLAVAAPAGIVTFAGTANEVLELDSETVVPPPGAASLRETVQLLVSPELSVDGLQFKLVRPEEAVS